MRKSLGALALVTLATLGAGCKKDSPLVGKWTAQAGTGTVAWEFKPDGTATMAAKNGPIEVTATESYKIEGEKVTLTVKGVDVKGGKAEQAAFIKSFAQAQVGKDQVDTVKFPSDEQAAITDAKGRTITLNRVKG